MKENYTPISILPVFFKVYEKLEYNRLFQLLSQHNSLYENLYGFPHPMHIFASSIIFWIFLSREVSLAVFFWISLKLSILWIIIILLNNLHHYEIKGLPLMWLKNYLSNWNQFIYISDARSRMCPITTGVPQGSILGPLLFLGYIDYMI